MRKLMVVRYNTERIKNHFLQENKLISEEDRSNFCKTILNYGAILLVPNTEVTGIEVDFLEIV